MSKRSMSTVDPRVRAARIKTWLPIAVCCLGLPLIYFSTWLMPRFVNDIGRLLRSVGMLQLVDEFCPPQVVHAGILAILLAPYAIVVIAIVFLVYRRLIKGRPPRSKT